MSHVLNASVFDMLSSVPLSRRFTSQILPKYTRFMVQVRQKFARLGL